MNLIEIEKVVSGLQANLFKRANSYSVGLFKSKFKGSGIQFREHQIYHPGDDVRFIDWKLSAKSVDKTYVKTFEEERNVEVVSIVDISPTMFTGVNSISKFQSTLEIICLIFLLTEQSKDYQNVILLFDEVINIQKLQGKKGIVQLVAHLEKKNLVDKNGKILNRSVDFTPMKTEEKVKIIKMNLARKKEVLFFTDFNDMKSYSEIEKFIKYSNFNVFEMLSPLDLESSKPFSFRSDDLNKKNFSFFQNSKKEIVRDKKIKSLNIEESYLENFVKEMMK